MRRDIYKDLVEEIGRALDEGREVTIAPVELYGIIRKDFVRGLGELTFFPEDTDHPDMMTVKDSVLLEYCRLYENFRIASKDEDSESIKLYSI